MTVDQLRALLDGQFTPQSYEVKEARTQKAAGLQAVGPLQLSTLPYVILQAPEEEVPERLPFPLFARPCPKRPRHGFVESRVVKNQQEVRLAYQEMLAADPDGELVVMPYVNAEWSGIWTPTSISIGPSHDGATAGKDSFQVGLVPAFFPKETWEKVHTIARLGKDKEGNPEVPYVELVHGEVVKGQGKQQKQGYYLRKGLFGVQVRAGVAVPLAEDYVPETVTAQHVVAAHGDLQEWEAICATFKPGTVAVHVGGTLASHYAVHCQHNKIPLVTSHQVVVGEVLQQIKETPWNYRRVLSGIAYAMEAEATEIPTQAPAVVLSLIAMHHLAALRATPTGQWLYGLGIGFSVRCGITAAWGELRHAARKAINMEALKEIFKAAGFAIENPQRRSEIYEKAWKNIIPLLPLGPKGVEVFEQPGWGGGFGGKAWAACLRWTMQLVEKVLAFKKDPTEEGFKHLGVEFNRVMNAAHNNGWWMNKFLSQQAFNHAAQLEGPWLLQTVPSALWNCRNIFRDLRKVEELGIPAERMLDGVEVGALPPVKKLTKKGGLGCAQASIGNGGDSLHIQWKMAGLEEDMFYQSVDVPMPIGGLSYYQTAQQQSVYHSFADGSERQYVALYVQGMKIICPVTEKVLYQVPKETTVSGAKNIQPILGPPKGWVSSAFPPSVKPAPVPEDPKPVKAKPAKEEIEYVLAPVEYAPAPVVTKPVKEELLKQQSFYPAVGEKILLANTEEKAVAWHAEVSKNGHHVLIKLPKANVPPKLVTLLQWEYLRKQLQAALQGNQKALHDAESTHGIVIFGFPLQGHEGKKIMFLKVGEAEGVAEAKVGL